MMKTRSRLAATVLIAVMAMGVTTGCANVRGLLGNLLSRNHNNDYAEINQKLDRDAIEYTKSKSVIVDETGLRRPGVVTDPQWAEFAVLVDNVINANSFVLADVTEWGKTNTKPPSFVGRAQALRDAQEKVIAFVKKVRP
jgi:lipoprotein-anchoring transpeptidase ErfK/SrfK